MLIPSIQDKKNKFVLFGINMKYFTLKVPYYREWDFHIFDIIKQILLVTLTLFKLVCYINIHPQNCCLHQT